VAIYRYITNISILVVAGDTGDFGHITITYISMAKYIQKIITIL